ncbi:ubiquitin-associated domain-containing protein 1-like [Ptychodera flava]|uniref:ubiquitin-associated domain-containing protein 1-like n=1 Tax=Ptychodera flava TaxID=63121 RepID=UPI00396A5491
MVVTESNLFEGKMKVRICDMKGDQGVIEVEPSISAIKLKERFLWDNGSMTHPEAAKAAIYFRLIHVASGNTLADESTLGQEGVKDGDDLILVRRRLPPPPLLPSGATKEKLKLPTAEDIAKATEGIPAKNADRKPDNPAPTAEFSRELRKILLTLTDTAHKLLCLNPDAVEIISQASEILDEERASANKVDEKALKQLRDMGFPENRASKALLLNRMSPVSAMEWLLKHQDDPDIDKPLEISEEPPKEKPTPEAEGATGGKDVNRDLAVFRQFRKRTFKPNQRAFLRLKEMGFEEKDVLDALKVNGNSEKAACDWLLGDRKPSVEDMDVGLNPQSALFQAIVNDPVVLLGLSNPRTLLAFEHILENPNSSSDYLNDSVIGPVLIQISRIYQTEKHAISSS